MLQRKISSVLHRRSAQNWLVVVTGPRQSGKTVLCRQTFPDFEYVSLVSPDMRDFASSDPDGFIRQYSGGAVVDEIQRTPDLLAHLVEYGGSRHRDDRFVLISSEQLRPAESVRQSIDQNSVLHLLPLDMAERGQVEQDMSINRMLCSGFFPRIYDQKLDPAEVYSDYFASYVERDVRLICGVENFTAFQAFIRLCAGRVGQLANLSAMASEVGCDSAYSGSVDVNFGTQLHRLPAPSVLRQYQETSGEIPQDLLLRCWIC